MRVILRGRRSIWGSWRISPVAPRIVNDVSYVKRINHVNHECCLVVQSSTGAVLCSTNSTGAVLCSTEQG